ARTLRSLGRGEFQEPEMQPSDETRALITDLRSRIDRAVEAARAEGHAAAMSEIRSLVGGEPAPVKRGPGRPRKTETTEAVAAAPRARSKGRKNPWTGLSPERKLARINAIR